MIIASFVILYLPNFLIEILDPTWKLPGLHVAAYIICWCWVFVNPGVYVFGCAYFRSAFKITYGLRLGSNDTTYASNSSKMRRNISCGTLTRVGSIANDRSIIVTSPAIVRSQSIARSPTAISLELQGPKFVKSPSTISFQVMKTIGTVVSPQITKKICFVASRFTMSGPGIALLSKLDRIKTYC